ncbi:MAG TPA: peptidase M14, partial [Bryobacteraceae bacterium]|nr:peptidase M14 [Bryobacteraceae bacterium]
MRRTDETVFHFRDTVRQHFVASLATCETAAKHRAELLANFYDYRKTAIEEGKSEPIREYVLVRRGDTSAVDKLAVLLADQGIEVRRATAPFTVAGRQIDAGSYLVTLVQPAKRLIRTLLDVDVPMPEPFLKEQERRRARRLPNEMYDVTAWSIPLLYNVELISSAEPATVATEPVKAGTAAAGRVEGANADVAWLVPWGTTASGRFLTAALRRGLRVRSTDKPFAQNGRKFPAGTLIVPARQPVSDAAAVVAEIAKVSGAEVIATATGWVEEGVNFGSRYVVSMRAPAIALAWDRPTSAASAGHTRFVLERQFGYPVTVVRSHTLATADLSRFQVLILPDAAEGYTTALGAERRTTPEAMGNRGRHARWLQLGDELDGRSAGRPARRVAGEPRLARGAENRTHLRHPRRHPREPRPRHP